MDRTEDRIGYEEHRNGGEGMTLLSKPVKTAGLEEIMSVLQTIPELKEVIRDLDVLSNRETSVYPFCVMVDEPEMSIERRNRIRIAMYPLMLTVCVKRTRLASIDDQVDVIQANIYNAFQKCFLYVKRIEELDSQGEKFLAGEDEGGVILRYRVTYVHSVDDAYDTFES